MIRRAAHTSLAVDCDDLALGARIRWCLEDLRVSDRADATIVVRTDGSTRRLSIVGADGTAEDLGSARTDAQALRLVAWVVSRQARRSVQHLTVLHASVLAGERGAIVVCGGTQTGKSTLTVAGVVRGLEYLSDDMAIVDAEARTVEPFARPIMLRVGGRQVLESIGVAIEPASAPGEPDDESFVTGGRLGRVAGGPRPIVGVGVLGRGAEPCLEPLSRAATLQALVGHCVTLESGASTRFAELTRLAETCPGWSVTVDPELRVVDALIDLVGGAPRHL